MASDWGRWVASGPLTMLDVSPSQTRNLQEAFKDHVAFFDRRERTQCTLPTSLCYDEPRRTVWVNQTRKAPVKIPETYWFVKMLQRAVIISHEPLGVCPSCGAGADSMLV